MTTEKDRLKGVAVIGMAGRFPGARNPGQFWENLCNGVESVNFFTDEDAIAAGAPPELVKHPDYVKAWGVMDDMELFDANFFGIPGREAEAMDPQHRHLMEVAASALEDAGVNPDTFPGHIGLISGTGISSYLVRNILPNALRMQALGEFQVFLGNDKDFMPTRVSYKLNLRGASHSVSSGCSTTMVAVHLACRSLLSYQNDVCLAGGANIKVPQKLGYLYKKGELKSPDGHCRAFDAKARGTVFSNGCVVVALKRLKDAIEDRDHIYAVIKGSAINNDGSSKAGFTAPSVSGQAGVIAEAHAVAGFPADTITYMEAHGTGTELGDPIEIKSLNRVFRETTDKKQYCAMASLKTNVGHLDNVAGVAGVVKTALCLKHKKIPASLHFERPNPEIDFANSPFFINTELRDWNPVGGIPRRACVSAFGAGGTNGHAVLEEAPVLESSGPSRAWQLLTFSAKTLTALDAMTQNLATFFKDNPGLSLADAAYSLNTGRRWFNHRRFVVCNELADATRVLSGNDPERVFTGIEDPDAEGLREIAARLIEDLGRARDDRTMTETLTEIGKRWISGAAVDWQALYAGERRFKVPLPTYPFEGKRYWVDQPKQGIPDLMRKPPEEPEQKKSDLADWCYTPSWKLSRLPATSQKIAEDKRCWVVFSDLPTLGVDLVERLRALGKEVVVVSTGDEFHKESDHEYFIDMTRPEDYNGMLTEMQNTGRIPEAFIHLWTVDMPDSKGADEWIGSGYTSIQCLAQAIDAQAYDEPVQLTVVSNNLHAIHDGERVLPEKAALLGPVQVIPQEMTHIRCKSVDVVHTDAPAKARLVSQIIEESRFDDGDRVVAYRGSRRWVRGFQPVRLDKDQAERAPIKSGGVYLITGGLGGLGLELAKRFAEKAPIKLALLGRTELPPDDQWNTFIEEKGADDAVSQKLRALQALKSQGASVSVLSADISDPESVRAAKQKIEQELGPVDGIVHAAGIADVGIIRRRTTDSAETVFAPKIRGVRALEQAFGDKRMDFMAFYSSLAAVMGGFGQVSYVAANCFLDAYAQSRADVRGTPVVTINWDAWREVGMATARRTEHLERTGLSSSEGTALFERVLGSGLPQVLVSTYDLETRIERAKALKLEDGVETEREDIAKLSYPRPEMSVPYVSPRNDLERVLADYWEDLMGMEKVGVDDDFFELGGDSLKGMNLVNRLEKQLDAAFHIDALFDAPNIAGLAVYLEENYPDAVSRLLGGEPVVHEVAAEERIDAGKAKAFRALIPSLPAMEDAGPKNRQSVFVLAPPRSGSTLLRVVLAGNPSLFAPPELFLLSFNKFRERKAAFPDKAAFWLDGLTRAVMGIEGCSEPFADSILLDWEQRDLTAKQVYAELQDRLGKRLLIDKTPSYAYDPEILARAERDFHEPLFIHLKRHPYGMIRSYDAAKMDLLLRQYADGSVPYNSRQIGELIYLICHQNIINFLKVIPEERQYSLKFEDLVTEPETVSKSLSEFLSVDYHEDMVQPYKEQNRRMTDGVRPGAKMLGDMNFHEHRGIDSDVAEKWRHTYKADFLGEETVLLAESFGYVLIGEDATSSAARGLDKIEKAESGISDDLIDQVDGMSEEEVEKLLRKLGDA